MLGLVVVIAAVTLGNLPHASPTSYPQALAGTPTDAYGGASFASGAQAPDIAATPDLPYVANWASGDSDWGKWPNNDPDPNFTDPNFHVLNGELVSSWPNNISLSPPPTNPIIAPAKLGDQADYAVEARIKAPAIADCSLDTFHGAGFGFVVRATDDGNGYVVRVGAFHHVGNYVGDEACDQSGIGISDLSAGTGTRFAPDGDWHTYRVEAKGNTITLLVDGTRLTQITDNTFYKAGRVGLWSNQYQIEVQSFTVTAL